MGTLKNIVPKALGLFLIFTVICGGLYTLIVTGIGQLGFSSQANGSLIEVEGKQYGSALLAQDFTKDNHLWGRVMILDTQTFKDENGKPLMSAVPSNMAVSSKAYGQLIEERVAKIKKAHPEKGDMPIPVDLVTASGSGLDPHISIAAADYQVSRLAKNNDRSEAEIRAIIKQYTTAPFLGFMGEARVNVLEVNLALEGVLK